MSFVNLPSEIYLRIFGYVHKNKDLFTLLSVCRACHSTAKQLFYTNVILVNNHQSFVTFVKNQKDSNSLLRYTKTLYIFNSWNGDSYSENEEDFSFLIQRLPNLDTIELVTDDSDWYLRVMAVDMQLEDLKKLKRVIIDNNIPGMYYYNKLMHKLRDTITTVKLPGGFASSFHRRGAIYLTEFKCLTNLEISGPVRANMDFVSILEACPKLQHLTLTDMLGKLFPIEPTTRVVCNNLKYLKLKLDKFPEHYMKYIMSCIPMTIHLELAITTDIDWMSFDNHSASMDEFIAHLSTIENLDFETVPEEWLYDDTPTLLEGAWRFAHRLRGNHRQNNMITSAAVGLVPVLGPNFDPPISSFTVTDNKYLRFLVPIYGILNRDNICLQDIPVYDMEDSTMMHSIEVVVEGLNKKRSNCALQFMQYMLKRCSRFDRLFVSDYCSTYFSFAPIALTSSRDHTTLPLRYVTTPYEDNILYAFYSYDLLTNHFLQSTLQMFPNIQTVRIDGCEYEKQQQDITIDLISLKHLHRLELNLKETYMKKGVLLIVNIGNDVSANYHFKRALTRSRRVKGPFELVTTNIEVHKKNEFVEINILCSKIDEIEIQWSHTNAKHLDQFPVKDSPPCIIHPQPDLFDRHNQV